MAALAPVPATALRAAHAQTPCVHGTTNVSDHVLVPRTALSAERSQPQQRPPQQRPPRQLSRQPPRQRPSCTAELERLSPKPKSKSARAALQIHFNQRQTIGIQSAPFRQPANTARLSAKTQRLWHVFVLAVLAIRTKMETATERQSAKRSRTLRVLLPRSWFSHRPANRPAVPACLHLATNVQWTRYFFVTWCLKLDPRDGRTAITLDST